MLICDRCRACDRGDTPVEPFAVVAGSLGLTTHQYEATAQLCPSCRAALRDRLAALVAEFRAGQRPRADR